MHYFIKYFLLCFAQFTHCYDIHQVFGHFCSYLNSKAITNDFLLLNKTSYETNDDKKQIKEIQTIIKTNYYYHTRSSCFGTAK